MLPLHDAGPHEAGGGGGLALASDLKAYRPERGHILVWPQQATTIVEAVRLGAVFFFNAMSSTRTHTEGARRDALAVAIRTHREEISRIVSELSGAAPALSADEAGPLGKSDEDRGSRRSSSRYRKRGFLNASSRRRGSENLELVARPSTSDRPRTPLQSVREGGCAASLGLLDRVVRPPRRLRSRAATTAPPLFGKSNRPIRERSCSGTGR